MQAWTTTGTKFLPSILQLSSIESINRSVVPSSVSALMSSRIDRVPAIAVSVPGAGQAAHLGRSAGRVFSILYSLVSLFRSDTQCALHDQPVSAAGGGRVQQ